MDRVGLDLVPAGTLAKGEWDPDLGPLACLIVEESRKGKRDLT